jgi:hypothetical protein
MSNTVAKKVSNLSEKLDAELTVMANAQFETPEYRRLFDLPLTLERARFLAVQFLVYNVNRRDCWAYVQAIAPWDVKRMIWHHEQDELEHDPRGGSDHRELRWKEALALGATKDELANAQATPLVAAALDSYTHVCMTTSWLGALAGCHFLERKNNGRVVRGGGFSARWRDKLVKELKIDSSLLIASNVHVIADMDHSDDVWETVASQVVDEYTYKVALEGAQRNAIADRAFRAALAAEMALL